MTQIAEMELAELDKVSRLVRNVWVGKFREWYEAWTGKPSRYGTPGTFARWDGGRTAGGRRYKSIWPKLAKHVLRYHLNPYVLADMVFRDWKADRSPTPAEMLRDEVLQDYQRTMRDAPASCLNALESEKAVVRSALAKMARSSSNTYSEEECTHIVLRNRTLDISPLLRYSLGAKMRFEDVQTENYNAAVDQYIVLRRVYEDVWGELIPSELRAVVNGIYRQLSAPAETA